MSELTIRLIQLVSCVVTAYCAGFIFGRDNGHKQERRRIILRGYEFQVERDRFSATMTEFLRELEGKKKL
jgi:hypothetical protein